VTGWGRDDDRSSAYGGKAGTDQAARDVLNNIGIGIILIGVFTPIVRAIYEPAALSGNLLSVGGAMTICFGRLDTTFDWECDP
jgi:hypothetical protein